MEASVGTRARALSHYDITCGKAIALAFAGFQGVDPPPLVWLVFAAMVRRRTGGTADGLNNPLLLEGAGWAGAVGRLGGGPETRAPADTALFATLDDGCRAAALLFQFKDCDAARSAYRAGEPLGLAAAIEASPPGRSLGMDGLAEEIGSRARSRRSA